VPRKNTARQRLDEMVAEAAELGSENEPSVVDWGPDVGGEIIDDESASKPAFD
jgi:antitoxin MazE